MYCSSTERVLGMSCFAVPHDLTCYLQIGIHHFLLYNLLKPLASVWISWAGLRGAGRAKNPYSVLFKASVHIFSKPKSSLVITKNMFFVMT